MYGQKRSSKRIMFRGRFCHPLSPPQEGENDENRNDLLGRIFRVLGDQDEQDMSFITEVANYEYAKSMQVGLPKLNLQKEFKFTTEALLDLFEKLLEFNPNFRISAEQAL